MQLWKALMKCKSLPRWLSVLHSLVELMWKCVVMELTDFVPQLCFEDLAGGLLDSFAGWGEFPLEKWKQTWELEEAQERKAPLDGESTKEAERKDKQWGQWPVPPEETGETLEGIFFKKTSNCPLHLESHSSLSFLSFCHHPKSKPPTLSPIRSWTCMDSKAAPKAQQHLVTMETAMHAHPKATAAFSGV